MVFIYFKLPFSFSIVTLMLRLLTFPLVVKMQRNVAIMNNYNPKLMAIQVSIFVDYAICITEIVLHQGWNQTNNL